MHVGHHLQLHHLLLGGGGGVGGGDGCPLESDEMGGRGGGGDGAPQGVEEEVVVGENPGLVGGGEWRPVGCRATHHVAVIVPFR